MALFVYLVTILVCSLVFLLHIRNKKSPISNWPLIGMLPALIHNRWRVHEYMALVTNKSGYTFTFKGPLLANYFIMTSDAANVQYILTQNFTNYGKGASFNDIFEVFGDGIFNSDSDWWKQQKKLSQFALGHSKFLRLWEKSVEDKIKNGILPILEHASQTRTAVDLQDIFDRLTFDISSILVMGFDPCTLSLSFQDTAVLQSIRVIAETILYRHTVPQWFWKLQSWLQMGQEKCYSRARKNIKDYLAYHIPQWMSRRAQKKDDQSFDMLTCLADEVERMGAFQVTDEFLIDTTINFMGAGNGTLSSTLSWFFWLLTKTPSVDANIRQEIKANFQGDQKEWEPFTSRGLKKLVYLHGALCESLRLYPPVPFNHKASIRPETLPSGHHIPADIMVIISLYAMGRNPEIWGKDCLEFKPDRWLSEQGDLIHVPPHKFIAFNAGPRSCLGRDISFFLLKQVASAMIWYYQFEVVPDHPILPNVSILYNMKYGLKVWVTKRGF